MQCRDLTVLYALHVNLHYMYKLWECVFFYFWNFNEQTAWYVNKSKIYNWIWIKVHSTCSSNYIMCKSHTTAILLYCQGWKCELDTLFDCSITFFFLVHVDVALIAYIYVTTSTVRSSCIQTHLFKVEVQWDGKQSYHSTLAANKYSKHIINSYVDKSFLKYHRYRDGL